MPRTPALILATLLASAASAQQSITTYRPFGTLREQAALQQSWLNKRMATVLPDLMRKYRVDMWVVPMREYNEDPVFSSLVSPTTFAARRRTIYLFFDPCGPGGSAGCTKPFERLALGGTSQGGVFTAVRSTKAAAGPAGGTAQAQAELWGDEQWQVLKAEIEKRNPTTIAINVSRVFAFNDGLSAGELEGMKEALGTKWATRFKPAENLALDLIATRLPEEAVEFRKMTEVVWRIIDTAFSNVVIKPGTTRTDDVVWWMRQKVNDLGLGTWFQPSVSVQRRGMTDAQIGANPVIMPGDVLHCDFGITAMHLNTDTQHMGYVLRDGEVDVPSGIARALLNSNRLQDIVVAELRPGRTGNEILAASRAKMRAGGIDGTVYSHPVGLHGHGAGPLIGLWDYQDGVPGRGDAKVIANMWYSIELQATTPVPEWNGQAVRSAQEEDVIIGPDGVVRWALDRQTRFHLVRPEAGAGRVMRDTVRSAALAKNVYGDSPDRATLVYLPPSYALDSTRRYPVVYLLHGFGGTEANWLRGYTGFNIQLAMDSLIRAGAIREMIVAMPNGRNRLQGSFYLNSAATGNWEDFLVRELVQHVDTKYRTIARPESRGLGGHSMGGFGTFAVGMRNAGDVYGALYSLSGCCTRPPSPTPSRSAWRAINDLSTIDSFPRLSFGNRVTVALGAVYAPNPAKPPLFLDPATDSSAAGWVVHEKVVSLWRANSPEAIVPAHADRLKRLRGFVFDVGTRDTLVSVRDLAAMDSAFTRAGVAHTFETYDGTHSSHIGERMITRVLPFFSKTLVFAPSP